MKGQVLSTPTITEKCCVPNDDHILSCQSNQGNGWANAVVRIGKHQFCDDIVGYKKLVTISFKGKF